MVEILSSKNLALPTLIPSLALFLAVGIPHGGECFNLAALSLLEELGEDRPEIPPRGVVPVPGRVDTCLFLKLLVELLGDNDGDGFDLVAVVDVSIEDLWVTLRKRLVLHAGSGEEEESAVFAQLGFQLLRHLVERLATHLLRVMGKIVIDVPIAIAHRTVVGVAGGAHDGILLAVECLDLDFLVHCLFPFGCFGCVLRLFPLNTTYYIIFDVLMSRGLELFLLVEIVKLLEVFVALNELGEPALDILHGVGVVKGKMGFLARLVLEPGGVLATILG